MTFVTIHTGSWARRPRAAVTRWFWRCCEIYKVARLRQGERELRRFHHLYAWTSTDDKSIAL
jgi:hypothetical protein